MNLTIKIISLLAILVFGFWVSYTFGYSSGQSASDHKYAKEQKQQ